MIVRLSPDGKVEFIAHPDEDREILAAVGRVVSMRRAGRVLPAPPVQQVLFRVVRALLGWSRTFRALTRKLPGPWIVQLPDGTILGPFADRREAVQAEELAVARQLGWLPPPDEEGEEGREG